MQSRMIFDQDPVYTITGYKTIPYSRVAERSLLLNSSYS